MSLELVVKVELLYFDECPNWAVADERLTEAAQLVSRDDLTVHWRKVATEQDAVAVGFTGFTCRGYTTSHGLAGSPSLEQLVEAMA